MGYGSTKIIDAEWSNHNVRITGKSAGCTTLFWGSDSHCSKDRLSVAIIVYE